MANIRDIEGIGDGFAGKLEAAGVATAEALLSKGGTAKGREALAAATGISEKLILRWVNHADLFRLKGVKGQFAELLEAAGVDSVAELAQRNAANLHDKLEAANTERKLVGRVPAASEIESWIAEAKTLPKAVSH